MKKSLIFALLLSTVFFAGCAVSKEKFNKDIDALAENPASFKQLVKGADPKGSRLKLYRELLLDQRVRDGIYEEAIKQRANYYSTENILKIDWFALFLHRGMTRLSLADKQTIAREMALSIETLQDQECVWSRFSFQPPQSDRMLELYGAVIKAGSVGKAEKNEPTKEETMLAVIALAAKAKETLSDQELLQVLAPAMEPRKAEKGASCKSITKIINLVLELDPKYQQTLLDSGLK